MQHWWSWIGLPDEVKTRGQRGKERNGNSTIPTSGKRHYNSASSKSAHVGLRMDLVTATDIHTTKASNSSVPPFYFAHPSSESRHPEKKLVLLLCCVLSINSTTVPT